MNEPEIKKADVSTELDAYDGEHQDKSCNKVLEGDVNASKDEPDDVS